MISMLWSRSFLLQPWILWALFWANLLGTLYGYEWYRYQLVMTWNEIGKWLVLVVPDSPTASLFFTITIAFLIRDRKTVQSPPLLRDEPIVSGRGIVEALSVITQVKYGIWAVTIILWEASLGDKLVWQDYMLMASHSLMAVEALLYMRFYRRLTLVTVAIGAAWTLLNDAIDYTFGVFPMLSSVLLERIDQVQTFTVSLSVLGIACAALGVLLSKKYRV
ncbi:DUF1405 domain-containing protein [Paenibacillus thermotolerans]|uniref:DUF1405 domain-containing protein n=1 Tax=Paenibacillus thermotolerans TaxID=3027807 RepID=UPI002368A4F1|nr:MULTISPECIES: DUF1405 domain-containing protein [unclassified Paenibacillus]